MFSNSIVSDKKNVLKQDNMYNDWLMGEAKSVLGQFFDHLMHVDVNSSEQTSNRNNNDEFIESVQLVFRNFEKNLIK